MASFIASSLGIALAPNPSTASSDASDQPQIIIKRKIVKRVIVWMRTPARDDHGSVRYVRTSGAPVYVPSVPPGQGKAHAKSKGSK